MEVLPYIKGWDGHEAAVRVVQSGEWWSTLPLGTQHAPPKEAGYSGKPAPKAPLGSPAASAQRDKVQASRGVQRSTITRA